MSCKGYMLVLHAPENGGFQWLKSFLSTGQEPKARLEHRRATSIRETLLERFFLRRHSSEDPGPEALHSRVITQPGARVQPRPRSRSGRETPGIKVPLRGHRVEEQPGV